MLYIGLSQLTYATRLNPSPPAFCGSTKRPLPTAYTYSTKSKSVHSTQMHRLIKIGHRQFITLETTELKRSQKIKLVSFFYSLKGSITIHPSHQTVNLILCTKRCLIAKFSQIFKKIIFLDQTKLQLSV